jgi:hypothetical protein
MSKSRIICKKYGMDMEGSITAYPRELHYTGICLEGLIKPIKHFSEEY